MLNAQLHTHCQVIHLVLLSVMPADMLRDQVEDLHNPNTGLLGFWQDTSKHSKPHPQLLMPELLSSPAAGEDSGRGL